MATSWGILMAGRVWLLVVWASFLLLGGTALAADDVEQPGALESLNPITTTCGVTLSWSAPSVDATYDGVVILRWLDTAPGPGEVPTDGEPLQPGDTVGNATVVYAGYLYSRVTTPPTSFRDEPVVGSPGSTVTYKIFAHDDVPTYSSGDVPTAAGLLVERRCAGNYAHWHYASGEMVLAPVTVRPGFWGEPGAYAVSNLGTIIALLSEPPSERARPVGIGATVYHRLAVVPLGNESPPPSNTWRILAGTSDGWVHSFDADTLAPIWSHELRRSGHPNEQVVAAPVVQLHAFSDATYQAAHGFDLVVFGLHDPDTNTGNAVIALDATDTHAGTRVAWTYEPGNMDSVRAQPSLSYGAPDGPANVVFVATEDDAGGQGTLRALATIDGAEAWPSPLALGGIETAPALVSGAVVVGLRATGELVAVDPADGATELWRYDVANDVYGSAGSAEVVFSELLFRFSGDRLVFTAQRPSGADAALHVMEGVSASGTPALVWREPLTAPTNPVASWSDESIYVGSGAGALYEYAVDTQTFTGLSLPGGALGHPALDVTKNRLYVGSEDGVLHAVHYPLDAAAGAGCPTHSSSNEVCDGLDNDCNGTPDDGSGMACALGTMETCLLGCGSTGFRICDESCAWSPCTAHPEICNGIDDDCDTLIDEDFMCPGDGSEGPAACASGDSVMYCHAATCAYSDCLLYDSEPCAFDRECDSGFCEDGYCCVEECGTCERCDGAGTEGTCTPDAGLCDDGDVWTDDTCDTENCAWVSKVDDAHFGELGDELDGGGGLFAGTVRVTNGNAFESRLDVEFASPNRMGLAFGGHYSSRSTANNAFGVGWSHTYSATLTPVVSVQSVDYLRIVDATGNAHYFLEGPVGSFTGAFFEKSYVQDVSGTLVWHRLDGSELGFTPAGQLSWIDDEVGNRLTLAYATGLLSTVTDGASGRVLTFGYDGNNRIQTITGPTSTAVPSGVWITYGYDGSGNQTSVTYAGGEGIDYTYGDANDVNNLTTKHNRAGHLVQSWTYDVNDRVTSTSRPDGTGLSLDYVSSTQVDVTDAYGELRSYTIATTTGVRRLTAMSGRAGAPYVDADAIAVWSYDAEMNLSITTMVGGSVTAYAGYDARGNPGTVTAAQGTPDQRVVSFTYHPEMNVPLTRIEASVLGGGNKVTTWDFDNDGGSGLPNESPTRLAYRVIEDGFTLDDLGATVAYSYVTSLVYDGRGQATTIDGPRSGADSITMAYNAITGDLESVTRPVVGTVQFGGHVAGAGKPTTITELDGATLTLSRDGRQRVTSVQHSSGATWGTTFDLAGEVEASTDADGVVTTFEYEPSYGRLFEIHDAKGNQLKRSYDSHGNLTSAAYHEPEPGDARTYRVRFSYYGAGAAGIPGRSWRRINPDDSYQEYDYDSDGNLDTLTDAEWNRTTWAHDALSRPTIQTEPGARVTTFDYDAHGNLATQTNPEGHTTSWTYDDMGRLVEEASLERGTVQYAYDAAGHVVSERHLEDVVSVDSIYDDAGRLTQRQFTMGADVKTASFDYDDPAKNGEGRLTQVTDSSGTIEYWYDALGRKVTQATQVGGAAFTVGRVLTPGGRTTSMTYPSGKQVTYGRDPVSQRLVSLTRNPDAEPLIANMNYAPFGPPVSYDVGTSGRVENQYDELYRLSISNPNSTQTRKVHTYDGNGNLLSTASPYEPWEDVAFSYDSSSQMVSATTSYGTYLFTYDGAGNRLTRTADGETEIYSYIPGTSQVSQVSGESVTDYTYDGRGNVATAGMRSFVYDGRNRMVEVQENAATVATYEYNALGQRASKTVGGVTTLFVYDFDGNLVAEGTPGGLLDNEYYNNGASRLAEQFLDQPTVLMVPSDESVDSTIFEDLSASSHTVVVHGDAHHVAGEGRPGHESSIYLDGTGDYLEIADSGDWTFDGDITMELWFRIGSNTRYAGLIYQGEDTSDNRAFNSLEQSRNNAVRWLARDAARNTVVDLSTPYWALYPDGWTHVAATRCGNVCTIYINGAQQAQGSCTGAVGDLPYPVLIGRREWGPYESEGYFDDVRISKVCRYGSEFTPPERHATASAIEYHMGGTFKRPERLVGADGEVSWQHASSPFGAGPMTSPSATADTPFRFPGQYADAETGYHYNHHRDYDPALGRYLQADPIGLAGGPNLYAYAGNNPMRFTDPEGRAYNLVAGGIGGIIGFGWGVYTARKEGKSWRDAVNKGGIDALYGASAGFSCGTTAAGRAAVGLAVGMAASAAADVTQQFYDDPDMPIDTERALMAGLLSSVAAGHTAAIQKAAKAALYKTLSGARGRVLSAEIVDDAFSGVLSKNLGAMWSVEAQAEHRRLRGQNLQALYEYLVEGYELGGGDCWNWDNYGGPPVTWAATNPTEAHPDDFVTLAVTHGEPPFYWEIVSGNGFDLAEDDTGSYPFNVLHAPASPSGCTTAATIRVTDRRGDTTSGTITVLNDALVLTAPETMDPDSTVAISVTGGSAYFTWESDDPEFVVGSSETRNNTLTTSIDACGTATVTVTDFCGYQASALVRSTVGQWVQCVSWSFNCSQTYSECPPMPDGKWTDGANLLMAQWSRGGGIGSVGCHSITCAETGYTLTKCSEEAPESCTGGSNPRTNLCRLGIERWTCP